MFCCKFLFILIVSKDLHFLVFYFLFCFCVLFTYIFTSQYYTFYAKPFFVVLVRFDSLRDFASCGILILILIFRHCVVFCSILFFIDLIFSMWVLFSFDLLFLFVWRHYLEFRFIPTWHTNNYVSNLRPTPAKYVGINFPNFFNV